MKKSLLISVACLVAAGELQAQDGTGTEAGGGDAPVLSVTDMTEVKVMSEVPNFIPTTYTKGNRILFYTVATDYPFMSSGSAIEGDFVIYDENFEEIKSFKVPSPEFTSYTIVRRRGAVTDPSTGVVTYTGEWEITRENASNSGLYFPCQSLSLRTEVEGRSILQSNDVRFVLTQTLFNEDEKFEYLYETYEVKESPSGKRENDRDGDGQIDEVISYYYPYPTGLEIRQDDGTVIFRHDNEYDAGGAILYYVGGKTFMVVYEHSSETYRYKYTVYSVVKETSDISYVKSVSGHLRTYPNPVRKGGMVTIELPVEGTAGVERDVRITSMDGRTLMRKQVGAGERTIQVPLQGMASGVYNFTLTENGRAVENNRIIVR